MKRLGLALLCLVVLNPGVVATEYAPAEGYRFLADPSTRLTYQVFLKDCVPCSAALVLLDDRGPIYARVAWLYSDNVSVAVRTPEAEARVTLVAETDPSGEYVVGVESFPIPNLPGPTEITAYTFASSPSTRAFHLEGGTVLGHSTSDRTFWSTFGGLSAYEARAGPVQGLVEGEHAWTSSDHAVGFLVDPPPFSRMLFPKVTTPTEELTCFSLGCAIVFAGPPGGYRASFAARASTLAQYDFLSFGVADIAPP